MRNWWQGRTLRLRLAVWFTAVASGILLGLTPVVYALIEHRLHIEFDRELHLDWDLAASHLEADSSGHLHWHVKASPGEDNQPPVSFEVWTLHGQRLLRHCRPAETELAKPLPPPVTEGEPFQTLGLENGLEVRAMEQETILGGVPVILRVFKDESRLHHTLREILVGFALGVPVAALLSALGGYVMAGRMLKPITLMAERARQITSESLSERLPYPNPRDELGQLAAVFNETLRRLEDSFHALKRFTADASHELRTPLTALRTVGEVGLREATTVTALRETIGSMLEEVQHLNDLTDSLLLLARVESGRSPLDLQPLRLDDLALEISESVEVLAAEKQQRIDVILSPETVARADRMLTRQAVMNVLHNAIRYSPGGGEIRLQSFRRGSQAVIEISDNGPGIAPEYQGRIFERFFRIDKARSREEGGAGLGLAIAKLAMEQQEGTIELESIPGKGSRFRLVLPGAPPS